MCKPNLFIVGAPKCGTTFLYHVLLNSNEIVGSRIKEPNYYCRNEVSTLSKIVSRIKIACNKFDAHNEYVYSREAYLKLFEGFNKNSKYFLDSSTNYLLSLNAAKEIFNDNPNSKIIICYREPTERLISHFKMGKTNGELGLKTLNYCINKSSSLKEYKLDNPYLLKQHSLYYESTRRFLKYFDKNQILFLEFNTIISNNISLYNFIEEFLGIKISVVKDDIPKNTSLQYHNKLIHILNSLKWGKLLFKVLLPRKLKVKIKSIFKKQQVTNVNSSELNNDLVTELNEDFIRFKKIVAKT